MSFLKRIFMFMMCAFNVQPGEKCSLYTRMDFGEPLPVILRNNRLLEPTDNYGYIELNYGEELTLSCIDSGAINHPLKTNDLSTAAITCDGGKNFKNNEWLSAPAHFTQFRCNYPPNYTEMKTNRTCFEGNPIYEVGYSISDEFYPSYESCFNEHSFNAIYSKYTQKPYNSVFQTRVDRPFFMANDVYGSIPVNSLFSPRGQRSAVAQLVGSMAETYMTEKNFLSRGHLAAKTDFVFAFGERATFHYVNCAPQWYGFNSGNWNTLEVDLRNHIHAAGYDTVIYTGTYGVTSLLNKYNARVDIYLYTDNNNNPVIPVPEFYYKVVYEPSTKKGIAYVGINNPYYTEAEADDLMFCADVCRNNRNFHWLSWHPTNAHEGYAFCCTIPDFKRTVSHLPDFEVSGLLI